MEIFGKLGAIIFCAWRSQTSIVLTYVQA